jgi:Alpha/beta hydrolase family
MAQFVMIAGGWHGGWAFTPIARKLRARGHDVFTPSLTGLGERANLAATRPNLDTHIEDMANVLLFEELKDVVLYGHSYAGMVISRRGASPTTVGVPSAAECLDLLGQSGRSTLDGVCAHGAPAAEDRARRRRRSHSADSTVQSMKRGSSISSANLRCRMLFGSLQICLSRRECGFLFSVAVVPLRLAPAQQKTVNGGQQEQGQCC